MGKKVFALLSVLLFVSTSWGHDKSCEHSLAPQAAKSWANFTLILDTNVIFNDPNVINRYPGATLVIPETVIKEVDKKKEDSKLGKAARQFSRSVMSLISTGDASALGIKMKNGSTLLVDSTDYSWVFSGKTYDMTENDNKILATAVYYAMESRTAGNQGSQVLLISDDINMRIKAASENLPAQPLDYQTPRTRSAEFFKWANFVQHKISIEAMALFKSQGYLPKPEDLNLAPNQFVQFISDEDSGSLETMARYHYDATTAPASRTLIKLIDFSRLPIQPKNLEQAMLLDVLLDPNIKMVISQSPAGTGKTFLALLAGLVQLGTETKLYDHLMVTRALVRIGKEDLGAMPGGMDEKLKHWNESVDDAFLALSKSKRGPTSEESKLTADERALLNTPRKDLTRSQRWERQRLKEGIQKTERGNFHVSRSKVNLVAFPHLRGRSISDAFLILDEAQNTSSHEMKTVLTRVGDGTKIIVLGDAKQIDAPYQNEYNNGLSVISQLVLGDVFANEAGRSLVAYIELTEGVRSELAEYCRLLFEKLDQR